MIDIFAVAWIFCCSLMQGITEEVWRLETFLKPSQNCIHKYLEQFQLQTENHFAVKKMTKPKDYWLLVWSRANTVIVLEILWCWETTDKIFPWEHHLWNWTYWLKDHKYPLKCLRKIYFLCLLFLISSSSIFLFKNLNR